MGHEVCPHCRARAPYNGRTFNRCCSHWNAYAVNSRRPTYSTDSCGLSANRPHRFDGASRDRTRERPNRRWDCLSKKAGLDKAALTGKYLSWQLATLFSSHGAFIRILKTAPPADVVDENGLEVVPENLRMKLPTRRPHFHDALKIDSGFWNEFGPAIEKRFRQWRIAQP